MLVLRIMGGGDVLRTWWNWIPLANDRKDVGLAIVYISE